MVPRLVPPVIPHGRMRGGPQPVMPAPGGLSLRPWLPSDAAAVVTAYRDPAIQLWHRRQLLTEAEARELIAAWNRQWQAETGAAWAVVRGDPGEALGRVSLRDVDLDTGQAEVGYWVLPAARGGGIAASAVTGLTRWALGDLGLHRLELMHSVANPASCRVAVRAGFRLEGVMLSALLHANGWHDMHLHAQTQGE
jgi:RimJ/RimL family protein N-acetyltransferase